MDRNRRRLVFFFGEILCHSFSVLMVVYKQSGSGSGIGFIYLFKKIGFFPRQKRWGAISFIVVVVVVEF